MINEISSTLLGLANVWRSADLIFTLMKNLSFCLLLSVGILSSCSFIEGLFSGNESGDEEPSVSPEAAFSMSADEIYKNETVTFSNHSANADRYEWDFGDGTESAEESPEHTYTACGKYTVTLTAYKGEFYDMMTSYVTVTSESIEIKTGTAVQTGKQYYPNGKTVNGTSYKYEFTVRFTFEYYGYMQASKWGFYVGNIYSWINADEDGEKIFESKIYHNSSPYTISYRAAAVRKGGNTDGDVFGESKSLTLR